MARMFPKHETGAEWESERRVRATLSTLSDSWLVFHSVAWQALRAGREGDGEADFLVIHPGFGILVLEVKGGRVALDEGRWYSTDRNNVRHEIKNPFQQARDSKYALIGFLASLTPSLKWIPVCYGVVLPDVDVSGDFGTYGKRAIVMDRHDLTNPRESLAGVFKHWQSKTEIGEAQIEALVQLLAPTIEVRLRLRSQIAEVTQKLLQLTTSQLRAMHQLRSVRRTLVLGGAGTGKTVLAIERARELERRGLRTLITCFNAPLAEYIRAQLGPGSTIRVETFHAFCRDTALKAKLDWSPRDEQKWWDEEAPNLLLRSSEIAPTGIEAVVVDEGQDFVETWFSALLMSIVDGDNAPFHVFADHHQMLYRAAWQLPAWNEVYLDVNCRNSLPVARRVAAVYADDEPSAGVDGVEPTIIEASDYRSALEAAVDVVGGWIEGEGLQPSQVAVLCSSKALVAKLRERFVAGAAFCALGEHGVVTETIARFKGLEADAVVVVLADPIPPEDTLRSLAYVGLSRPTSVLSVICSPTTRRLMNWG